MRMIRHGLAALVLLAAVHAVPVHAAESYDNCTGFIETLPATISTQGTWCLKHDVATAITSGNAITIAANNVTLDCNDFKIGGLAAGVGTNTNGIWASSKLNATVRNCSVRGFLIGIDLSGSGHLVEDNRIDQNTSSGLILDGDGMTVRRNRVVDTGGRPGSIGSTGIYVNGSASISDNTVEGVTVTGSNGFGSARGINLANGPFDVVGNFISNLVPVGAGVARGIWSGTNPANISGNTVLNAVLVSGAGVDGNQQAACRDNTVGKFATGITQCTVEAGNLSF